jgi:hypothetical protein
LSPCVILTAQSVDRSSTSRHGARRLRPADKVLGAHSVGAPHIIPRLYWGAARLSNSDCSGRRSAKSKQLGTSNVAILTDGRKLRKPQMGGRIMEIQPEKTGRYKLRGWEMKAGIPDRPQTMPTGSRVPDERRQEMPEAPGAVNLVAFRLRRFAIGKMGLRQMFQPIHSWGAKFGKFFSLVRLGLVLQPRHRTSKADTVSAGSG